MNRDQDHPEPSDVLTAGNFFRWKEFSAADAPHHSDTIQRLLDGDLHAAIIRDVYDASILETVVERLEQHDPPFVQTWFPDEFQSWFYGENLNLTHPDLGPYFSRSATFHAHLAELFPAGQGIVERVGGLISQLDQGRPFVAPKGPEAGQQYQLTTLRAHRTGGFIPPHFDNEQALRPSYQHLMGSIMPHMLSFVLALSMAEQGGALRIFDMRSPTVASRILNDDQADWRDVDLQSLASVTIRLPPGAMILVDSGQYLHEVTPVVGKRKRWTVCSFFARSRDDCQLYAWG